MEFVHPTSLSHFHLWMDQRTSNVHRLLADHLHSPSLRHIRDPHFLTKLAKHIVKSSILTGLSGATGKVRATLSFPQLWTAGYQMTTGWRF
jgi:hypothetical protein